ncbi:GyrI-like domain-containing protein [Marinomonas lutimaris]|uniref:GyrI-like domain-containing protein n=1 Tax=Marinomonas lutimaris TaxID=2846746 RepID=UPI001C668C87|nr:GyrI-like domain-containing protein [Marinomonas lutimaris]
MKQLTLDEKRIVGLSVRTNNVSEMQSETAKIGALHQIFAQKTTVNYEKGACLYGVYYQYESDYTGDFSVLVGAEPDYVSSKAELEHVDLSAGEYLVFSGEGEMPQVVIDVWGEIWRYFSSSDCVYYRAYTADFECYTSENSVDVYIAVKP